MKKDMNAVAAKVSASAPSLMLIDLKEPTVVCGMETCAASLFGLPTHMLLCGRGDVDRSQAAAEKITGEVDSTQGRLNTNAATRPAA
jgi:hypothetical protein